MVNILKEVESRKDTSDDMEETEEPANLYTEDETTSPDEVADFEKYAKEQARKTITNYMKDKNACQMILI